MYKMVQFNYFNYMKKNYLSVLISMPPDIRSFTKTKQKDEGKSYKDEFIRILNVLIHVFYDYKKKLTLQSVSRASINQVILSV